MLLAIGLNKLLKDYVRYQKAAQNLNAIFNELCNCTSMK